MKDHGGAERARSQGGDDWSTSRGGAQGSEKLGNHLIKAELETGKAKVDPSIRTELPKRIHRTEGS